MCLLQLGQQVLALAPGSLSLQGQVCKCRYKDQPGDIQQRERQPFQPAELDPLPGKGQECQDDHPASGLRARQQEYRLTAQRQEKERKKIELVKEERGNEDDCGLSCQIQVRAQPRPTGDPWLQPKQHTVQQQHDTDQPGEWVTLLDEFGDPT